MSKKNKKSPAKPKVYIVDMNVYIEDLNKDLITFPVSQEEREDYIEAVDEWSAQPAETRGPRPKLERSYMSAPEFFKDIIMKAINMTHKTGNTASLRRTKAVCDVIDIAIEEKDGRLEVMEEDYKYMVSALNKADKWNNTEDSAKGILRVADALAEAEGIHAKKPATNDDLENEGDDEG